MKRRFRKIMAIITMLAILVTFTNIVAMGEESGDSDLGNDFYGANSTDTNEPGNGSFGYDDVGYNDVGNFCYYCYNCPCDDGYDCDCLDCPCKDGDDTTTDGGEYPIGCPVDCPADCSECSTDIYPEDCPEDCTEYCCIDYPRACCDCEYDCDYDCECDCFECCYEMIDELYVDIMAAIDSSVALQEEIDNVAQDNEIHTITISTSFQFDETITIPANKIITITGETSTQTLTVNGSFRHFIVQGQLTLGANITLFGPGGDAGAEVTSQTFPRGGGVLVASGGNLTLDGATISNNRSNEHGGGVENRGTFTMTSGTISGNAAFYSGGGVHNHTGANFTMSDGIIGGYGNGNIAHVGAGVGNLSETNNGFTMSGDAVISHNTTQDREILSYRPGDDGIGTHGGGVRNSGTFIMEGNAIISYNRTVHSYEDGAGGGVWQDLGSFVMRDSASINNNFADHHGGGVYINVGSFTMSGNTFINNNSNVDQGTAQRRLYGGGVFVSRNATGGFSMSGNAIIHDNSTTGYGGGVATQRTFTMSGNAIIHNNIAAVEGGGVFVSQPDPGNFVMSGGTIHSNTALRGGGVYNANTFTMSGGTIGGSVDNERNLATAGNGGGVFNAATGRATITAGTIRFNTATGNGGGVFTHHYPNLTLSAVVVFNSNLAEGQSNYATSIYFPGPVSQASSGGGDGGAVEPHIARRSTNLSIDNSHPLNNFDVNFIGAGIPLSAIIFHPNGGSFAAPANVNEPEIRFLPFDISNNPPSWEGLLYEELFDLQGNLLRVRNSTGAPNDYHESVSRPTRAGWRFLGWSIWPTASGNLRVPSSYIFPHTATHTLFALWERIPTTPPTPEVDGAVDTNIPRTGDDTSMAFWLALLSTSLAGGVGLLIWKRKRIFN